MTNISLHAEDQPHKQFNCDKGIHDWGKWKKKWFTILKSQHRYCSICNLEQIEETCTLICKGLIK
jgi:hypothetical protein